MEVRAAVERHLAEAFGPVSRRAGVTFLGAEPIDVLRFGPRPDGFFRYVTVGMSAEPMGDPAAAARDPAGPRAELVLSLRAPRDSVVRRLAVLAAIPAVEGVPVVAGAGLDLGEPLWDDAVFHGVLVGEPGGLVADLELGVPTAEPTATGPTGPTGSTGSTGSAAPAAPDRDTDPAPVRFLPVFPMTPNESAFKRVHGAAALRERWLAAATDLRDPQRRGLRI